MRGKETLEGLGILYIQGLICNLGGQLLPGKPGHTIESLLVSVMEVIDDRHAATLVQQGKDSVAADISFDGGK